MHATSRLPKCICLCVLFMPRYLNIPTSPLSLNSSTLSISNDKCRLHNWEDFLQTVHAVIINQSAQTCPRITSHYTHLIAIAAKLNSQTAFSDSELPVCVINEHSGHNYSPPPKIMTALYLVVNKCMLIFAREVTGLMNKTNISFR